MKYFVTTMQLVRKLTTNHAINRKKSFNDLVAVFCTPAACVPRERLQLRLGNATLVQSTKQRSFLSPCSKRGHCELVERMPIALDSDRSFCPIFLKFEM